MMKGFIGLFLIFALVHLSSQQMYDSANAFEMMRAASASYCSSDTLVNMQCGGVCNDLHGYQFVRQFSADINADESLSYSVLFNPDLKIYIISFRGTRGVDQLLTEMVSAESVPYQLHDIPNAAATKYFYNAYTNYLRNDLISHIQSAVNDYPDYDFHFVGHSLGGALATLAALDMSYAQFLPKSRINLYTYGSPRVGDFNFAQAVVNSVNIINRVVHHQDAVPHLPPCVIDFSGNCSPDADHSDESNNLFWHAWHIWPEIFYTNDDASTYTICNSGEDRSCSDQYGVLHTNKNDHLLYFGIATQCQ